MVGAVPIHQHLLAGFIFRFLSLIIQRMINPIPPGPANRGRERTGDNDSLTPGQPTQHHRISPIDQDGKKGKRAGEPDTETRKNMPQFTHTPGTGPIDHCNGGIADRSLRCPHDSGCITQYGRSLLEAFRQANPGVLFTEDNNPCFSIIARGSTRRHFSCEGLQLRDRQHPDRPRGSGPASRRTWPSTSPSHTIQPNTPSSTGRMPQGTWPAGSARRSASEKASPD